MSTIGSVNTYLRAHTGTFDKKMRRSGKTTRDFAKTTAMASKVLVGFAAAMAAVAAIRRFSSAIGEAIDKIDTLAKVSKRLRITVGELQSLRLAADISGVATQALDKSIQMMVRRIGEVRGGTGEAKQALERLGISVDSLVQKSTIEQFLTLINAIRKVPVVADRAALAYQLFGRQGMELLNIIDDGSAAFRKADHEMTLFGKLTEEQARTVENLKDEFTRLTHAVGASFLRAIADLAPALERISKLLQNLAINTANAVEWFNELLHGAQHLSEVYVLTLSEVKPLVKPKEVAVAKELLTVIEQIAEVTRPDTFAEQSIAALRKEVAVLEEYRKLVHITGDDTLELAALKVSGADQCELLMAQDLLATRKEITAEMQKAAQDRSQADALKESLRTPLEAFRDDMIDIQKLFNEDLIDEETVARATAAAAEGFKTASADKGYLRVIESARLSLVGGGQSKEKDQLDALLDIAKKLKLSTEQQQQIVDALRGAA